MEGILVTNFTNMFKRDILLYSLGEFRLNSPISLKKLGYILFFIIVYTGPILYFNGLVLNVWYVIAVFVPPFIVGYYAAEPRWAGRNLLDFTIVYIKFATSPKYWCDLRACNDLLPNTNGKETYKMPIGYEIWISRRRELQELRNNAQ